MMNTWLAGKKKSFQLMAMLVAAMAMMSSVEAHHARSYTPGISKYQSINSFRHMIGYGTQKEQLHKKSHHHRHRDNYPKRYKRWHRHYDRYDHDDYDGSRLIFKYYSD